MPPGQYRRNNKRLLFYEKKEITKDYIEFYQGIDKEPRIVTMDQFAVVGMEYFGANTNGEIPELWNQFTRRIDEIPGRNQLDCSLGICDFVPDYDPEKSEFSYLACIEVHNLDRVPPDMIGKTIPGGKYAVFTHRGDAEDLGETYRYIYGTFFPKSNLELAQKADFEVYGQRFTGGADSEMEIYIPIE